MVTEKQCPEVLVWTYTVESNYGRHHVVGTDNKTKARLVASCLHRKDADRICAMYTADE